MFQLQRYGRERLLLRYTRVGDETRTSRRCTLESWGLLRVDTAPFGCEDDEELERRAVSVARFRTPFRSMPNRTRSFPRCEFQTQLFANISILALDAGALRGARGAARGRPDAASNGICDFRVPLGFENGRDESRALDDGECSIMTRTFAPSLELSIVRIGYLKRTVVPEKETKHKSIYCGCGRVRRSVSRQYLFVCLKLVSTVRFQPELKRSNAPSRAREHVALQKTLVDRPQRLDTSLLLHTPT